MSKLKKEKLLVTFMMMYICILGILCYGTDVSATEATSISGSVPCSTGSVTWTLDDEGTLLFSGTGTTDFSEWQSEYIGSQAWRMYWDRQEMERNMGIRQKVLSVKVDEGSAIQLDTCSNMFDEFVNCVSVDLAGIDTQYVLDMSSMFEKCSSLERIDLENLNTKKVRGMMYMFADCDSLSSIDLSGFETDELWSMGAMFAACDKLEIVNLSSFDTKNVRDMGMMFYGCSSLKEVDLSSFDLDNLEWAKKLIEDCPSLEKLVTPKDTIEIELTENEGKLWMDAAKNFYDGNPHTFHAITTLYNVYETYQIDYVYEGKLVDCPKTYKVRDGLTQMGTVDYDYGTFEGWYLDEKYTTPFTSIEKGTFGDVTLYAKITPNTYNITYVDIENATNIHGLPKQYTYGEEYAMPALMATCHMFRGWYLDKGYTQSFAKITPTTNGHLTLYAKWEEAHNYDMTNGKVLKEATATETGTIEYTCKNCAHKTTAVIPKLTVENVSEDTLSVTDETILDNKNDNDIKGSSFVMIQARADKVTKNSVSLKWNKVKNADGYKIYGNKCGKKNRYKYIKTISNGKTTKFTQKKLKKGTYYKYIVRAYKLIDGQEVTIAASKTIHASTTGGKYGNAKSVKIKTDKKMKSKKGSYTLTIKKNKKYTIKASEVKQSKKIKKHRVIKFESSDASIATVNSKGSVKGIKKGTCYIYAYAQNGIYKKIKVKVK